MAFHIEEASAVQSSPISQTHGVLERARELASVITALADELCGAIPQPTSGEKLPPPSNGILAGLADHSKVVNVEIDRANESLSRIRRML
jgi:hypothetical protein